jgi:hypothetical protein
LKIKHVVTIRMQSWPFLDTLYGTMRPEMRPLCIFDPTTR